MFRKYGVTMLTITIYHNKHGSTVFCGVTVVFEIYYGTFKQTRVQSSTFCCFLLPAEVTLTLDTPSSLACAFLRSCMSVHMSLSAVSDLMSSAALGRASSAHICSSIRRSFSSSSRYGLELSSSKALVWAGLSWSWSTSFQVVVTLSIFRCPRMACSKVCSALKLTAPTSGVPMESSSSSCRLMSVDMVVDCLVRFKRRLIKCCQSQICLFELHLSKEVREFQFRRFSNIITEF